MERRYVPTFAELVDRLSIVTLKSIFIPQNKAAYDTEAADIVYDLNALIKEKDIQISGEALRAAMIIMLSNRYIWENESKCRRGDAQSSDLLKVTHSINGVRNTAKNVISKELGERVDLKVDCLAADVVNSMQNWNLFSV